MSESWLQPDPHRQAEGPHRWMNLCIRPLVYNNDQYFSAFLVAEVWLHDYVLANGYKLGFEVSILSHFRLEQITID